MIALWRKKRFKFRVDLMVADLCDVPLVSNSLFAKIRLLEGGTFADQTRTVAVAAHRVCWSEEFTFTVRLGSDEAGYLLPAFVRVSVRKETKGGKTFEKLGFVDVDLAGFAGSGAEGRTQSFLLEGYRPTARQDNSRLRLNVAMSLLSSDPLFKVPRPFAPSTSAQEEINPRERKAPGSSPALPTQCSEASDRNSMASLGGSVASSSGFGSVSRENAAGGSVPTAALPMAGCPAEDGSELGSLPGTGHSRNASSTSSGCPHQPALPSHSRQSSVDGAKGLLSVATVDLRPAKALSSVSPLPGGHDRRPSSDLGKFGSVGSSAGAKMAGTRVDAEDVIQDLLKDSLLIGDMSRAGLGDEEARGNLCLYVSEDGSAAVGSDDMPLVPNSNFRKVFVPAEQDAS